MDSLTVSGVYALEIGGGRIYIGSTTTSIATRLRQHFYRLRHGNHYAFGLQEYFNQHGKDGIGITVLEPVLQLQGESKAVFRKRLFDHEQRWLNAYEEAVKLNTYTDATSPAGIARKPEYRAKTSRTLKKRYSNPVNRERLNSNLHSPSAIAKTSEARRKRWQDPDHRAKMIAILQATTTTPEARAKRSQSAIKTRDKQVAAYRQTVSTLEWKIKRSANAASKALPTILIDPAGTKYVTDSLLGFSKQFNLNRSNLAAVARGANSYHKQWTGRKLESWAEVPSDAIRVLWGEHPDLPEHSGAFSERSGTMGLMLSNPDNCD